MSPDSPRRWLVGLPKKRYSNKTCKKRLQIGIFVIDVSMNGSNASLSPPSLWVRSQNRFNTIKRLRIFEIIDRVASTIGSDSGDIRTDKLNEHGRYMNPDHLPPLVLARDGSLLPHRDPLVGKVSLMPTSNGR